MIMNNPTFQKKNDDRQSDTAENKEFFTELINKNGNGIAQNQHLKIALEQSEATVNFQRKSFDALLAIAESLGDSPTIEDLFMNAIKPIKEVTGFSTIAMRLHNPENRSFQLLAYSGLSTELAAIVRDLSEDEPYFVEVAKQKHPIFISVFPYHKPFAWGFRRLICVPFLAEDTILGTMELTTLLDYDWNEDELRWFKLVGRYIGILIKQIQMNQQFKNMAILQERSRIAQELHDGLVQTVGAINIWSQEAKLSLKEGENQTVHESLNKIEISAQDAYTHLREEMFGLRVLYTPGKDIIPLLNNLLVRYQHLWGIKTFLHTQLSSPDSSYISLSPDVELQLLRVVQEALTNIRRHANAKTVNVNLIEKTGDILVEIVDDGNGFDISKTNGEGFGLHIMRERVSSVGGTIDISSGTQQGTTIDIHLPKITQAQIFRKGATNVDDISG